MLQMVRHRPSMSGETIVHEENQMMSSSFVAIREPSLNLTGKEPALPLRATA
jgi:hypothetical protein